jgi:hypothetical protein
VAIKPKPQRPRHTFPSEIVIILLFALVCIFLVADLWGK